MMQTLLESYKNFILVDFSGTLQLHPVHGGVLPLQSLRRRHTVRALPLLAMALISLFFIILNTFLQPLLMSRFLIELQTRFTVSAILACSSTLITHLCERTDVFR